MRCGLNSPRPSASGDVGKTKFGDKVEPTEQRLGRLVRVLRREGLIAYPGWDDEVLLALGAEPSRVLYRHPEGAGAASASRNGERWVFFAPAIDRR